MLCACGMSWTGAGAAHTLSAQALAWSRFVSDVPQSIYRAAVVSSAMLLRVTAILLMRPDYCVFAVCALLCCIYYHHYYSAAPTSEPVGGAAPSPEHVRATATA
eukprot:11093-Heterococcus_DN1.PRE.2